MNKLGKVAVAVAMMLGAGVTEAEPLFEGGKTAWRVCRPSSDDCTIAYAVQELTNALKKVSGADFAVTEAEVPRANEIFVGVDASLPAPGDEVVVNRLEGGALRLVGNSPRAALHAVYAFLQRELGVRWLWQGEDGEFMPRRAAYSVPAGFDWRFTPSIRYRGFHRCGALYKVDEFYTWAARNFICIYRHGFRNDKMKKLGFYNMLMTDCVSLHMRPDLYAAHPEYYCERTGQRQKLNVCFASEGAVEESVKMLQKEIEAHRGPYALDILSIMLADNQNYCQCAKCRQMSVSDGFFTYYNRIVSRLKKKYPDLAFATIAYQGYCEAPTRVIPEATFVEYATHSRCQLHPFHSSPEECPLSSADLARMGRWEKLGVTLGQYTYEYNAMDGVFLPFYSLVNETIDLAAAHRHCLVMPEVMLSPPFGPDAVVGSVRNRLSEQFFAQKMWDASLTLERWMDDMTRTAFGPAAASVAAYLREMDDAWTSYDGHYTISGSALVTAPKILTPERRARAQAALAAAGAALDQAAARGEDVVRFRANLARENTLFAQWTAYADKAAGRWTTVRAPRLLQAEPIGEGRATAYDLADANGKPSGVQVRFAWVGARKDRDNPHDKAVTAVVEFLGLGNPSSAKLGVEISRPGTEDRRTFCVEPGKGEPDGFACEVSKGVCRLVIPLTGFASVPTVGSTWRVRCRVARKGRKLAFPAVGGAAADLVFMSRDAADRPLLYFYGNGNPKLAMSDDAIRSEKQLALDNGFAETVVTNAAMLGKLAPGTKAFYIREADFDRLPAAFKSDLKKAVADGGVAFFFSYWDLGLEKIFGDPSFKCDLGVRHGDCTQEGAVLDGDYIRQPNDLYRTFLGSTKPAYAQHPVDESKWTVCLRQEAWVNGVKRPDCAYLSCRPYGKGYVIAAADGNYGGGAKLYRLLENFLSKISKKLKQLN